VAATWAEQSYWATDSPFAVSDNTTALATVRLDQTQPPDDLTDHGFGWEVLGEFEVTSNALIVSLSNDANDAVVADAIRIERVNNPPDAIDDAIELNEGATSTVLVGGATSLLANDTDPDLPDDTLTVTTTPVVDVAHGTLVLNANGTFEYLHDGSETVSDSFVYQVKDSEGLSDIATVTIEIAPVNDAPVLTVPGAQTVDEDAQLTITGVNVADDDAGESPVAVSLSAAHGAITLAQTAHLVFTLGDGTDDVAMQFSGKLTDVNSALASIRYLGEPNFHGSDAIDILVDDQGHTGLGGDKTETESIES